MNIKDYISSGILECYLLGQLNRTDAARVEMLSSQHPEIKEELIIIEEGMQQFAAAYAKNTPPHLKDKMLGEIAKRGEKPVVETKIKHANPSGKKAYFLITATLVIAFLLGITSLYYFQQWRLAQFNNVMLRQEIKNLSNTYTVLRHQLKTILEERMFENNLELAMHDTANTYIELTGLPIAPSSVALIFWNKKTSHVLLYAKNLPEIPPNKQFQLWALNDGVPINAGIILQNQTFVLQTMKNIEGAQAFLITLEDKGGGITPTMEMIHLIGNI